MPIFTIKASRGGRPKTFTDLEALLHDLRYDLTKIIYGTGAGKIIIEVKHPDLGGRR